MASISENCFIKYENKIGWFENYELIIEIVDGTYWEVYAQDQKLINFLEKNYRDTEKKLE